MIRLITIGIKLLKILIAYDNMIEIGQYNQENQHFESSSMFIYSNPFQKSALPEYHWNLLGVS